MYTKEARLLVFWQTCNIATSTIMSQEPRCNAVQYVSNFVAYCNVCRYKCTQSFELCKKILQSLDLRD
ncbi:MAG: hypothetical protein DBY24_07090 [Prevotellaceae bacterium]|nr:MAG: hypothetical protein DBY24_07090 [Prevotellaceae bacterium]